MDSKSNKQAAKRCSVSLDDTGGMTAFEGRTVWKCVKETKENKCKINSICGMQSGRVGS